MRRDTRKSRFGIYLFDNIKKPKFKCENCGHVELVRDCRKRNHIICSHCAHVIVVNKKDYFKEQLEINIRKKG